MASKIETFFLRWTIDGNTTTAAHASQHQALQRAEELMREHGCDLEIILHLNQIEPSSLLFNKKRMRDWCRDGFPVVRI